jgi:protein-disulfide isomerase
MNKNVIVVAVVVVVVGALALAVRNSGGGGAVTAPVEVEGLDDQQTLVRMAQGVSRGSEDAPMTILEFGDFQCPSCRIFATGIKPQVELAWIESGDARFVYYDFPLVGIHPHAFLAARAGRCAEEQGEFWAYHDVLYQRQSAWAGSAGPPVSDFEDYAAEAGLDQDAFSACLRSDRHAALVTANMRLAQELGVTGTPTIMINSGGTTRTLPDFGFETIMNAVESMQGGDEGERR